MSAAEWWVVRVIPQRECEAFRGQVGRELLAAAIKCGDVALINGELCDVATGVCCASQQEAQEVMVLRRTRAPAEVFKIVLNAEL